MYAATIIVVWGVVNWATPDFWVPHLFLYGPRWLLSLPAPGVVLLIIRLRLRWLAMMTGVAAVSFAGVWGYNIPWTIPPTAGGQSRPTLRLLTCNVQRGDLRARDLADLVRSARPDIVLLQEWGGGDPRTVVGPGGWYTRSEGEFCLVSRYPIEDFATLRRPDKGYRIIAARAKIRWSGSTIPIVAVHLMTPRDGLEAILHSPLRGLGDFRKVVGVQRFESGLLRRWIEENPGPLLLAGDFNLTAEHPLYRRDWSGHANAFTRTGWGLGRTMFTRHMALRIDHILSGHDWVPIGCWVGPDVGSAHRPVVAELVWKGRPPE